MMQPEIRVYLEEVRSRLYLRTDVENQLVTELNSHLHQKLEDLVSQGYPEEEAAKQAVLSFGKAENVARLLYEACCKGSWADALKLSLSHFLAAAIFISAPLHKIEVLVPVFGIFISVSLFGWLRGKPDWLYSWIGYVLLPLFAGGFLLFPVAQQFISAIFGNGVLPSIALIIETALYYLFSIWIILRISLQAIKRDWLIASLMLAPIPIVGCWLFYIQQASGFYTEVRFEHLDQLVAQALMVLGFTSVLFIRLRQRLLKAGVIMTVLMISMMIIGQSLWGDIGFFGLMVLSLSSLVVFIVPAATDVAIGRGNLLLDTPV